MKTLLLILSLSVFCIGAEFDTTTTDSVYITIEHEMSFERYKILARVWYPSGDRWFVLDADGTAVWSDKPVTIVR